MCYIFRTVTYNYILNLFLEAFISLYILLRYSAPALKRERLLQVTPNYMMYESVAERQREKQMKKTMIKPKTTEELDLWYENKYDNVSSIVVSGLNMSALNTFSFSSSSQDHK